MRARIASRSKNQRKMDNEPKRAIIDLFAEAEAGIEAMGGSRGFVDAVHHGSKTDSLIKLKEDLALGQFSEFYNRGNSPKLGYAQRNERGSGRADFTVWDEALRWNRDLELTSIWEREDDFPRIPDEDDPDGTHVVLSEPRLPLDQLQAEVRKYIKRVLYQHARRRDYPPYWLAIYNNLSLMAYNLPPDYVANIVRESLIRKPPTGNLKRIWVWNPRLDLVFSAQGDV
jgi:hypothetical protein